MQDERLYDEKELEKSWLISYSDLFTLLFVIIVIIAAAHSAKIQVKLDEVKKAEADQQATLEESHKTVDLLTLQKLQLEREIHLLEAKRRELVSSIEAIGNRPDEAQRDMDTVKTQLSSALQELNIDFEETGEGLMVRLPESVLFASGSAELEEKGKSIVGTIAGVLERFSHRVRIEGYTDDVPVVHSPYRSNWELSSARAIAVMREMVDGHGLPASRFTVAGMGEYNPLLDNSNEQNRARNRRVEIVILADKVE
ncbi:OmpA family protein [Brevibacillus sp. H7]|uniref:OmpA family protein n=1 Tax=Brevibacillus sp. H7 TaxID=3349138 RepID=UPI0037FDA949